MRKLLGTAAILGALAFAPSANAATTLYNFTLDGMTGSLPAAPYGTVSVNDNGGTSHFTFDVNLGTDFYFQDSKAFQAFDYSLGGNVTSTVIATSGFSSAGLGSYSAPNIVVPSDTTKFNYAILCQSLCAGGNPNGKITQLVFDVFGTNLNLSPIDNTKNYGGTPIYFAADVSYQGGSSAQTGNIGAVLTSGVPEPSTWALFFLGFGAIGLMMRSRRQTVCA
ncbi:MAG TPA: PEPxxWA-CTERM sorting domain-containing protein [Rhizomicrobium sp.]|jgi:hypothetical protein